MLKYGEIGYSKTYKKVQCTICSKNIVRNAEDCFYFMNKGEHCYNYICKECFDKMEDLRNETRQ